ncbi:TNF receptor-associated factor 1 isoform X2 [Alligator mississippiensis]|nr:TNF receptor-associated factor 1-like [Alligator sinensis]XP_006258752.1 TNF receptor-associated factor 1 isoform X2 [Alligator mississippiensis]XP_059570336.1 TNF receptor-associated factor 1 isoform X2 [Alligator mississippiensis]
MSSMVFSPWSSSETLTTPQGGAAGAPAPYEEETPPCGCYQALRRDLLGPEGYRAPVQPLFNDLDRVHHGPLEAHAALLPGREGAPGASDLLGPLEQRLGRVELQQKTLHNILAVMSRELSRREEPGAAASEALGEALARILQLEEKVAHQDSLLAIKDVMISSLGARIQTLEQTSYDGRFLWKVTDITLRRREAQTGQRLALYSPSFYTHRYGYKLCLKLFLNGDGAGAGTHLSLFLVVMRGEYDFQLQWPFQHKVTFSLLDQSGQRHVSTSFRPLGTSSSFQRPVGKNNIASGLPEFFPLRQLEAPSGATYLQEDTLVFQALIDPNV